MNRKTNRKNQMKNIRQVAYNPQTRRFEVVTVEDETLGHKVSNQYRTSGKWVTIPESE